MQNKIMIRDLLGLKVEQRTEDAYFNATLLFQQWNDNNPNKVRRFDNFKTSKQIKDFVKQIYFEEIISNPLKINEFYFPKFQENKNESDLEVVAFKYAIKQKRGNKKKGIPNTEWVHPLLFIKVAQYISPSFDYAVTKMVADKLLVYRVDVCNRYDQWSDFLQNKLGAKDWDYSNTQKEMNKAVFGFHETNIRDKATEEQLKLMEQYEDTIYNMYDLGFIKDCKDVRNALKIFQEKNFPKEKKEKK